MYQLWRQPEYEQTNIFRDSLTKKRRDVRVAFDMFSKVWPTFCPILYYYSVKRGKRPTKSITMDSHPFQPVPWRWCAWHENANEWIMNCRIVRLTKKEATYSTMACSNGNDRWQFVVFYSFYCTGTLCVFVCVWHTQEQVRQGSRSAQAVRYSDSCHLTLLHWGFVDPWHGHRRICIHHKRRKCLSFSILSHAESLFSCTILSIIIGQCNQNGGHNKISHYRTV